MENDGFFWIFESNSWIQVDRKLILDVDDTVVISGTTIN